MDILDDRSIGSFIDCMQEVKTEDGQIDKQKLILFADIFTYLASRFPTTICLPNVSQQLFRSLPLFHKLLDKREALQLSNVFLVAAEVGLELKNTKKYTPTGKNTTLALFEGAFLLSARSSGIFDNLLFPNAESFCMKYTEFGNSESTHTNPVNEFYNSLSAEEKERFRQDLDDDEREKLKNFYNIMVILSCMTEQVSLGSFMNTTSCISGNYFSYFY